MNTMRLLLMMRLYTWSSRVYATLFKAHKASWGISKDDFVRYAPGTLGKALGDFYEIHAFDVMPKLENHDVFHLLTNTGVAIQDEIAMQYLLLGNGKVSLYLVGMIVLGSIIYPEFIRYYGQHFQRGRRMQRFYHLEFQTLLDQSLADLQFAFSQKTTFVNS